MPMLRRKRLSVAPEDMVGSTLIPGQNFAVSRSM
jgi:hypothetical protein